MPQRTTIPRLVGSKTIAQRRKTARKDCMLSEYIAREHVTILSYLVLVIILSVKQKYE